MKVKSLFTGDAYIWFIVLSLCAISFLEVGSASNTLTYKSGNILKPILSHGGFLVAGIGVGILMGRLDYRKYAFGAGIVWFISFALCISLLFVGQDVNGASRWMGVAGFNFQPSEFAKVSFVVIVSGLLGIHYHKQETVGEQAWVRHTVLGLCLLMCLVIGKENYSTAIIIFIWTYLMLFIGKVSGRFLWRVFLYALLLVSIGVAVAMFVSSSKEVARTGTAKGRIERFLAPKATGSPAEYEITGDNFQETYARIGIAKGSLLGTGPGNGEIRYYLPQAFSDFIYVVILEELGLLGGGFVLFLYLLLLYRALQFARGNHGEQARFLVMGISLLIVMQALINICVAAGVIPVTGQTLPLVSRGGSSILVMGLLFGILLGITGQTQNNQLTSHPNSDNDESNN